MSGAGKISQITCINLSPQRQLSPCVDHFQYLVRVLVQRSISPPSSDQALQPNGTSQGVPRWCIYKTPLRKGSQERWIPGDLRWGCGTGSPAPSQSGC